MKKLYVAGMLICCFMQNSYAAELSCQADYAEIIAPDLVQIAEELKHNRYDILKQKTHASLVEFSGGQQAYAQLLDFTKSMLDTTNIEILDVELSPPLYSYQVDNEEVCFIPKQITMKLAGQQFQAPRSFFIAARPLNTHTWTYLDGSGVEKNPNLMFIFFPHFPKDVALPFAYTRE